MGGLDITKGRYDDAYKHLYPTDGRYMGDWNNVRPRLDVPPVCCNVYEVFCRPTVAQQRWSCALYRWLLHGPLKHCRYTPLDDCVEYVVSKHMCSSLCSPASVPTCQRARYQGSHGRTSTARYTVLRRSTWP